MLTIWTTFCIPLALLWATPHGQIPGAERTKGSFTLLPGGCLLPRVAKCTVNFILALLTNRGLLVNVSNKDREREGVELIKSGGGDFKGWS